MAQVRIINGSYRKAPVVNQTFTLVKGFQTGKNGSWVTVKNEGHFDIAISDVKVKVESIDEIEFHGTDEVSAVPVKVKAPVVIETDVEAMDRIAVRFSVLDEMAKACIDGSIRSVIVTGPPGIGKSFGVEQQMEKASLFDQLAGKRCRFEIAKGAVTALGLYALLYKFSDKGNVIVMDDLDVWGDELCLNILKGALDSGKKRKICWNSDSSLLRREGIPDSFEFHGSVVFITNVKFSNIKSKKTQDHLEALQSRCHFLDLAIETERDKMLRIHQVHRDADGGLFAEYDFVNGEAEMVMNYMLENAQKLREVSMRCALKIADLIKIRPEGWRELANVTVCKS